MSISGTGKTVPYLAHEIAEDFNLLKEFSGEDIRRIHYLNFEDEGF